MSASDTSDSSSDNTSDSTETNINRQPARRVFAEEARACSDDYQGSGEYAPRFLLMPTVAANRVFVVGNLTDVVDVSDDDKEPYLKGTVSDPTGEFYVYAGQYQPQAKQFLMEQADAEGGYFPGDGEGPTKVAITAKPRLFETDEGRSLLQLQPERMSEVTEADRRRWIVDTAQRTLARLHRNEPTSALPEEAMGEVEPDLGFANEARENVRQAAINALEDYSEIYGDLEEGEASGAEVSA